MSKQFGSQRKSGSHHILELWKWKGAVSPHSPPPPVPRPCILICTVAYLMQLSLLYPFALTAQVIEQPITLPPPPSSCPPGILLLCHWLKSHSSCTFSQLSSRCPRKKRKSFKSEKYMEVMKLLNVITWAVDYNEPLNRFGRKWVWNYVVPWQQGEKYIWGENTIWIVLFYLVIECIMAQ